MADAEAKVEDWLLKARAALAKAEEIIDMGGVASVAQAMARTAYATALAAVENVVVMQQQLEQMKLQVATTQESLARLERIENTEEKQLYANETFEMMQKMMRAFIRESKHVQEPGSDA